MNKLEPTRTYSDPTVTEILRRLLNERGVEWDYGITGATTTRFNVNGLDLTFTPMRDGLMCSTILTPEQAIAATLGAGACHDEGDPGDFCCSECGVRMFTDTSDTYTMIASDGRTIIKRPNYCPNCGRRVI